MTDDPTGGRFSFKRQLPALRLFEVPGLALSPGAIAVAALASILISVSGWLVDRILPVEESAAVLNCFPENWRILLGMKTDEFRMPVETAIGPLLSVIRPISQILSSSAGALFRLNALAKFVLMTGTWSLVGGILCRRTAYRFAGDDEKTLTNIVRYSFKRWLASFGSPLIPLSAALLLALTMAGLGFASRLPYIGSVGLFIGSPVMLIIGFLMAFLLLATALSWPLMVASVAIDDCESFGGLSRAYSCLTGRPRYVIGYFFVSFFLGEILMELIKAFQGVAVWCVLSSLEIGSGSDAIRESESLLVPLNGLIYFLMSGIGISYFWSATAVIYLLVRLEIDGVPMDQVSVDDADRPAHDPLPVVGIPATDVWAGSNGSASPGNPTDVI